MRIDSRIAPLALAVLSVVVSWDTAAAQDAGTADRPGASDRSTVVEQLRTEAETLRTTSPETWAAHRATVERIESEYAARREGWRSRRPPPPPDYRPAKLPVAFLFALYQEHLESSPSEGVHRVLATALAAAEDERGLAFVVELHDADVDRGRKARYVRLDLAREIAGAVALGRIPSLLAAQIARKPPVESGALALRLLLRTKERLPDDVRTAARDWLATYPRGPHNGLGDEVWKLRMRVGDASDREALIPHLLGKEHLLDCLWAILEKPLPHPRLAAALRERADRMSDHERSVLARHMKKALLLTAPDEEVRGYVAHLDALHASMPAGKPSDPVSQEFHDLVLPLRTLDHPVVEDATRRFLKSEKLDWTFRCVWLASLIRSKRREAADLRTWWDANAPERLRTYLVETLARE